MELCLLRFALSFNLALPRGKTYFSQELGQLIAIQADTKHGSASFSYEKDYTSWLDSDDKQKLIHSKPNSDIQTVMRTINIDSPHADFRGGLVDAVDYSVLTIIFENAADDFLENLDRHMLWAEPIVQRFIDNYQLATNRHWLGGFRASQQSTVVLFAKARPGYIFQEGSIQGGLLQEGLFHASFDFGSYQLRVHHPRFSGLGVVPPSDSELALFEARLTGGDVSEPHEKLMMEAVLQVDRHRDFDLAIVHGETAFEVFVQKMLANYCHKNKVQALPGKKAASLGNQQAIETGNIQNDLFRYIEHCTGFDVKSTPEYNAWLNDAYNPRVAIIHRGARGMSEAQAKKALDTINAIMSVVRKLLT